VILETERVLFEAQVRTLCSTENFDGAATQDIGGYGGEIFGFLVAVHRDETARAIGSPRSPRASGAPPDVGVGFHAAGA
jgi:hypothetical protein